MSKSGSASSLRTLTTEPSFEFPQEEFSVESLTGGEVQKKCPQKCGECEREA